MKTKIKHFTWRRNMFTLLQSRLADWLISTPLTCDVTQVKISPGFQTDHRAISMNFDWKSIPKRGPGLWKFPSYLPKYEEYTNSIKRVIEKLENEYEHSNPHDFWEFMKFKIRQETISYSKDKRKRDTHYKTEHQWNKNYIQRTNLKKHYPYNPKSTLWIRKLNYMNKMRRMVILLTVKPTL